MRGHTLSEMLMVIFVFSFFLLALMAIFNVGLKSWNLTSTKSEVQHDSSVSMTSIIKDLRMTDASTVQIGGAGKEYIVFESPIGQDNRFHYDEQAGPPIWQAYILYYTYPRDPGDLLKAKTVDMSLLKNKTVQKRLIRKKILHTPNPEPVKWTNFQIYFTDPDAAPLTGEILAGKPRVLSDHIYSMTADSNMSNMSSIIVKITTMKSILEDRLAYTKDFSQNVGIDRIELKATVILKNTRD